MGSRFDELEQTVNAILDGDKPDPEPHPEPQDFPRVYANGSTAEPVYSDFNLTDRVGCLNPYEECLCLTIYQGRPIVQYAIDGEEDNDRVGFVRWAGGVQD